MHQPRLLFLDAYDSFSNNIIVLLHEQLNAHVETIHIDDKRFATRDDSCFHDFLRRFDGVIAGPGPGDPRNSADLGLIGRLWNVPEDVCLPVLGVCLGFQSLALAFGASAEKLCEPRHGLITEVTHRGVSLFKDSGIVRATQYHSLHARLDVLEASTHLNQLWELRMSCPEIEPLAWDLSDVRNGPVLMALKHRSRPFFGVQYHPESICTNDAGASIIQNWWSENLSWSLNRAASRKIYAGPSISASYAFDSDHSDSSYTNSGESSARSSIDVSYALPTGHTLPTAESTPAFSRDSSRIRQPVAPRTVSWTGIGTKTLNISATAILESLQDVNVNTVMLESGTKNGKPVRSETGRFSIIACLDDAPQSIRYSTSQHRITSSLPGTAHSSSATIEEVWSQIETFMTSNKASGGATTIPFWGGLVGFVSYEAGLETIDVSPPSIKSSHPDIWFVFVERSVVIDHVEKKVFVQTLHEHDTAWMQQTEAHIRAVGERPAIVKTSRPAATDIAREGVFLAKGRETPSKSKITAPIQSEYEEKVRLCQHHIRAGDSYELCLTDQSRVSFPAEDQPAAWELYNGLRATNPAPFGAYLRFNGQSEESAASCDGVTILSSSPERFLSWSRAGKCQFRPIKGTVLKTEDMTREKADAILKSDKEQAENLMIVDLIRHDLHGVVGSGNVSVEKLMQVEEYETVYQLVSVIEGQLPSTEKTGIDVLAASLPPGSMTGAPKKRSCELLRDVEVSARSIYSGVMGYFDVGGGGDFSVIIRTAFRWEDEEEWCLGAGGAVTTLSTAKGEFEEMMAKRASSLRAFERAVVE